MKPIDLLPLELRDSGPTGRGRSGGVAYVLVAFAAVVAGISVLASLARAETDDLRAQVERVTLDAAAQRQNAQRNQPFVEYARVAQQRVSTVDDLKAGRIDWARTLGEIARVTPPGVSLVRVAGSATPTGSGSDSSRIRQRVSSPAVQIRGCADDQDQVALFLARLRSVSQVQRVTLVKTEKPTTSGSAIASDKSECRVKDRQPQFDVLMFFNAPSSTIATAMAAAASGAPTAPATPTPTATGETQTDQPATGAVTPPGSPTLDSP